jgi:hypothetical protein
MALALSVPPLLLLVDVAFLKRGGQQFDGDGDANEHDEADENALCVDGYDGVSFAQAANGDRNGSRIVSMIACARSRPSSTELNGCGLSAIAIRPVPVFTTALRPRAGNSTDTGKPGIPLPSEGRSEDPIEISVNHLFRQDRNAG